MLAGLMLIAAANELILLFAGLELVSIPTYVLLYVGRHDQKGQEAASKYFFLSILSSAVLLYGFSFLYGIAGSMRLPQIAQALSGNAAAAAQANFSPALAPLAMLLVFAALAFRLTAVPFHFYAPDVYQGTSHANAGVLATLPKIAGLAVLARIVIAGMPTVEMASLGWKIALVISVLTMTLGNVMALWQNNIRRLLAYSSIAHAGYILIGVAVALAAQTNTGILASDAAAKAFEGLGAAMFYLAVYMFATMGAFAALGLPQQRRRKASRHARRNRRIESPSSCRGAGDGRVHVQPGGAAAAGRVLGQVRAVVQCAHAWMKRPRPPACCCGPGSSGWRW